MVGRQISFLLLLLSRFISDGLATHNKYRFILNFTDDSLALVGYEYMGCYTDRAEKRLLNGEMFEYPEMLTTSLCLGICKKKGYTYAGLESRYSTYTCAAE